MVKVIIGAVVAGLFSILGIWFRYFLKNKDEEYLVLGVSKHPIFSRMEYLISQIDYSMEFEDVAKYMLVTDVMEKYFQIVKRELKSLAENVEEYEKNENSYNVHDVHLETINRIIDEYTDISNYERQDLDSDSKETLTIFLSKFQKWHRERVEFLRERSAEISNSNFYTRDIIKVAVLFDVYVGIMASTLHDGSKTLQGLNGELEGKSYRGVRIGVGGDEIDESEGREEFY